MRHVILFAFVVLQFLSLSAEQKSAQDFPPVDRFRLYEGNSKALVKDKDGKSTVIDKHVLLKIDTVTGRVWELFQFSGDGEFERSWVEIETRGAPPSSK